MEIKRPKIGDYAPYYETYISKVEDGGIVSILEQSHSDTIHFLKGLSTETWQKRYAEGKWTVAELMMHVVDSERVFAYRALRIARGDSTPLPGFDQEVFVPNSNANNRSPESIIEEYDIVRTANLKLFQHFTDEMWQGRGIASDNEVTTLAVAFIIAGHETHHINIIKERYL
ncbi:MAG: DinB family protein [Chitinophagales bacterium]|nr:DinB family protein [Chitinophagales bacterium]